MRIYLPTGCARIIGAYIFRDYRDNCAETAEAVVANIFGNAHQESKLNATHSSSPLMTLFSH